MKKSSLKRGVPRRTASFRLTSLPAFGQLGVKWATVWGVAGLVLGALLMVGKTAPFAESGAKPGTAFSYFFWVPAVAAGAAAAGLGIGLLFGCLMAVTSDWRDSLEGEGLLVTMAPEALCGFMAGLVAGLLIGGLGGALFFGTLGALSAAGLNWWASRRPG